MECWNTERENGQQSGGTRFVASGHDRAWPSKGLYSQSFHRSTIPTFQLKLHASLQSTIIDNWIILTTMKILKTLASKRICVTLLFCAVGINGLASSSDEKNVIAWLRDGNEKYQDTPYIFLGAGDWELNLEVKPCADAALELLWGSKKDVRYAVVSVGGKSIPVKAGGDYDGFRWLSLPLPKGVISTNPCKLVLSAGEGKPAFIAEVRLTAPGGNPARPALSAVGAYCAKGAQVKATEMPRMPVFPEMRAIWDLPSPYLSTSNMPAEEAALWSQAEQHARLANEALYRSRKYIDGWLAKADPETGLIPRNLRESRDFWNGRDSAADNYPFMVLTAAITDRPLFEGRMLEMLKTETRLTSRVGALPDDYSFSKHGWRREKIDLDAIMFDAAEYVKDGLIPITEWLGPSPWSDRAVRIIDDIWAHAPAETPFGKIPTLNFEVNGDLLQACSRLYWFTGDRKYLDWAIRLGDYYLLGANHPTRDLGTLSLGDHSCEVINGLSELYVACAHAAPDKRKAYQKPLQELYDTLLKVACDPQGFFYLTVNLKKGTHSDSLTDNWGYNYDGFYTAYLMDGKTEYRDAVRKTLGNLKAYHTGKGGMCQSGSADGYADSIEGAITLLNREWVPSAAEWADAEIRTMWGKQKADGVIEGWHGDGNSARTSIMYTLWKTQGILVRPWREDVRFGAVKTNGVVYLYVVADKPWSGTVLFDKPRHKINMHLPLDYPRINQFPEWFVVEPELQYELQDGASGKAIKRCTGQELIQGAPVKLEANKPLFWCIKKIEG